MTLFIDKPLVWPGMKRPSCHLISSIPGPDGTSELVEFAKSIKLLPNFIQRRNTEYEHFDLFGKPLERVLSSNIVQLSRRPFVDLIRHKRIYYSGG